MYIRLKYSAFLFVILIALIGCAATKPSNIVMGKCTTSPSDKIKLKIALVINDQILKAYVQQTIAGPCQYLDGNNRWVTTKNGSTGARSEYGEIFAETLKNNLSCGIEKVDIFENTSAIKNLAEYDFIITPTISASATYDGEQVRKRKIFSENELKNISDAKWQSNLFKMEASMNLNLTIQETGSKDLPLTYTLSSSSTDDVDVGKCGQNYFMTYYNVCGESTSLSDNFNKLVGHAFCNAYNPYIARIAASLKALSIIKSEARLAPADYSNAFLSMAGSAKTTTQVNQAGYSANPFKSIQELTQKKIDRYLSARMPVDVNAQVPPEISKPELPPAKKLDKDQFESKAEFEQRVNKAMAEREKQLEYLQFKYRRDVEARNAKIEQLKQAYAADVAAIKNDQEAKKAVLSKKVLEFTREAFDEVMGEPIMVNPVYNPETETMQVDFQMSKADYKKRVDLKVPRSIAKEFHANIAKVVPFAIFSFEDNSIKLRAIKAIYEQKTYAAALTEKQFQPEKIEVALKDTKVDFRADQQANLKMQNPNLIDTFRVNSITYGETASAAGKSYVDDLKPLIANLKQKPADPKKWLFMIAVEHYNDGEPVTFAKSSAEAFRDTAQKAFGIDQQHTIALIDDQATTAAFTIKLNFLLEDLIKEGDTIYFYYSGHGVPDNKTMESFILPKDAIPDYVAKDEQFQLTRIYKRMTDSKAGKIVAFVDACFSGKTDTGQLFKGTAPALSRTKKVSFDESKMAILAAARDDQYANAYDDKGYRMFSYFVVKGLLSGRDNLDSLYKEVSLNVHDVSKLKGQARLQDPQLIGNKNIGL